MCVCECVGACASLAGTKLRHNILVYPHSSSWTDVRCSEVVFGKINSERGSRKSAAVFL